jgi:hypothetical protein
MKKILIGLTLFASMSSFATDIAHYIPSKVFWDCCPGVACINDSFKA